jgi:truncated hemoglobin YjbI
MGYLARKGALQRTRTGLRQQGQFVGSREQVYFTDAHETCASTDAHETCACPDHDPERRPRSQTQEDSPEKPNTKLKIPPAGAALRRKSDLSENRIMQEQAKADEKLLSQLIFSVDEPWLEKLFPTASAESRKQMHVMLQGGVRLRHQREEIDRIDQLRLILQEEFGVAAHNPKHVARCLQKAMSQLFAPLVPNERDQVLRDQASLLASWLRNRRRLSLFQLVRFRAGRALLRRACVLARIGRFRGSKDIDPFYDAVCA